MNLEQAHFNIFGVNSTDLHATSLFLVSQLSVTFFSLAEVRGYEPVWQKSLAMSQSGQHR
jgi:hypothetical protein